MLNFLNQYQQQNKSNIVQEKPVRFEPQIQKLQEKSIATQNTNQSKLKEAFQDAEEQMIFGDDQQSQNWQMQKQDTQVEEPVQHQQVQSQQPEILFAKPTKQNIKKLKQETGNTPLKKRKRHILKQKYCKAFEIIQATLLPVQSKFKNKMFKVQLQYRDGKDEKVHNATIWFGDRNKQYFFQHQNKDRLRLAIAKVNENDLENPFCQKYWEFQILNNSNFDTIQNAWKAYINEHILK